MYGAVGRLNGRSFGRSSEDPPKQNQDYSGQNSGKAGKNENVFSGYPPHKQDRLAATMTNFYTSGGNSGGYSLQNEGLRERN